jgi:hypothetical protein
LDLAAQLVALKVELIVTQGIVLREYLQPEAPRVNAT